MFEHATDHVFVFSDEFMLRLVEVDSPNQLFEPVAHVFHVQERLDHFEVVLHEFHRPLVDGLARVIEPPPIVVD